MSPLAMIVIGSSDETITVTDPPSGSHRAKGIARQSIKKASVTIPKIFIFLIVYSSTKKGESIEMSMNYLTAFDSEVWERKGAHVVDVQVVYCLCEFSSATRDRNSSLVDE